MVNAFISNYQVNCTVDAYGCVRCRLLTMEEDLVTPTVCIIYQLIRGIKIPPCILAMGGGNLRAYKVRPGGIAILLDTV